ncbi:MAG: phage tail protein [Oscillatoria sp. SIO1A7]|nr:phage tail protein [Oscillatoria sp. SIO1A7]
MPKKTAPHQPDPYSTYNFYVEWDGMINAGFQECTGLNTSQTPTEYREGTDPNTVRKLAGLITYDNITLRRGTTNNKELWEWREKIMNEGDKDNRKSVSIVLMDHQAKEKIRWNLINCWPVTWSGAEMNAMSSDVALETLEFCHEGVTVDSWA